MFCYWCWTYRPGCKSDLLLAARARWRLTISTRSDIALRTRFHLISYTDIRTRYVWILSICIGSSRYHTITPSQCSVVLSVPGYGDGRGRKWIWSRVSVLRSLSRVRVWRNLIIAISFLHSLSLFLRSLRDLPSLSPAPSGPTIKALTPSTQKQSE
jgi:hypothetical protein